MYKKFIFIIFSVLLTHTGIAGHIRVSSRIYSGETWLIERTNSTLSVCDPAYDINNPGSYSGAYLVPNGSPSVYITLNIDLRDITGKIMPNNFLVHAVLATAYEQSNHNSITRYDTLEVFYSATTHLKFKDIAEVRIPLNYPMALTYVNVSNIQVLKYYDDGTTAAIPQNELLNPHYNYSSWYIETRLETDRFINLTTSSTSLNPSHTYIQDVDELKIYWTDIEAEEYELEYTYIDYSPGSITSGKYNFRNSCSRIKTTKNWHNLPMTYGQGVIVYRVRALSRHPSDAGNGYQRVYYSSWSIPDNGNLTNASYYFNSSGHRNYLNWQQITTFAEDAKSAPTIKYLDGTLRERQTVTKRMNDPAQASETENENIYNSCITVTDFLYDYMGRQAVNFIPTPIRSLVMDYYPNLNKSLSSQVYSKDDFEVFQQEICSYQPDYVSSQMMPNSKGGAGHYYSDRNEDLTDINNFVIPSCDGFPFSQTVFMPDNTNRILAKSIPGEKFRIGSGHETRYYYGTPSQEELDRLFGNDAGEARHYKKNMIIDPNGQVTISYNDLKGNTIATALAGDSPENLVQLTSSSGIIAPITEDLLSFNIIDSVNYALISEKTILVSKAGVYSFIYTIEPETLQINICKGISVCYDCIYDLEFKIVSNECTNRIIYTTTEPIGSPFNSNGDIKNSCDPQPRTITYSTPLEQGCYTITKKLKVNEASVDLYLKDYLKDTCTIWNEIRASELARIDTSQCDYTCSGCVDLLNVVTQSQNLTPIELQNALRNLLSCFNSGDCDPPKNNCETAFESMATDVSPYGQYGEIQFSNDQYISNDPLSVYNTTNSNLLPSKAIGGYNGNNWLHPGIIYLDDDNQEYKIEEDNGPITLQQAELNALVNYYQDNWAKELVPLHPEYCYYQWCKTSAIETLYNTNTRMNNTNTYSLALQAGFLSYPQGDIDFSNTNLDELRWAFLNTYATKAYFPCPTCLMVFSMPFASPSALSLVHVSDVDYSYINDYLKNLAKVRNFCTTNSTSTQIANAINVVIGNITNVDIQDSIWRTFRAIYLGLKENFLWRDRISYSLQNNCFNGCIGNEGFMYSYHMANPITSPADAPCNADNCSLYYNKVKRFPDAVDNLNNFVKNSQSPDVDWNYQATNLYNYSIDGTYFPFNRDDQVNLLNPGSATTSEDFCNGCDSPSKTYGLGSTDDWKTLLGNMIIDQHKLNGQSGSVLNTTLDVSNLTDPSAIKGRYGGQMQIIRGSATSAYYMPYFLPYNSNNVYCEQCRTSCGTDCCIDQLFMEQGNTGYDLFNWSDIISIDDMFTIQPQSADRFSALAATDDLRRAYPEDFKFFRVLATCLLKNNGQVVDTTVVRMDFVMANSGRCMPKLVCDTCIKEECLAELNPPVPGGDLKALMTYLLIDHSYFQSTTSPLTIDLYASGLPTSIMENYINLGITVVPLTSPMVELFSIENEIWQTCSKLRVCRDPNGSWAGITSIISFVACPPSDALYCIPDQTNPDDKGKYECYQMLVLYSDGSKGMMNVWRRKACGCHELKYSCPPLLLVRHSFEANDSTITVICSCNPCNIPQGPPVPQINNCIRYLRTNAIHNAKLRYDAWKDDMAKEFRRNYLNKCLKAAELFSVSDTDNLSHITLYYYDQANNLVRTIPPEGVDQTLLHPHNNTIDQIFASIKNHRNDPTINQGWYPTHAKASIYAYNSLNQVIEQSTPDAGITHFCYDECNRLIRSQNARQTSDRCTYTLYDNLNRINETGEAQYTQTADCPMVMPYASHLASLDLSTVAKSQITRTLYNNSLVAVPAYFGTQGQNNLRNRVASRYYQSAETTNDHLDDLGQIDWGTHYSYDIEGNVSVIIQETPLLKPTEQSPNVRKKIEYEYDLISGKVNALYYQKGSWDQFIHKYEYDDLNRLRNVYTSADATTWDNDATYFYHRYGPLARMELGTSKVQGLDYAYTLQGWIKGVNSAFLDTLCDIGNDGLNDAALANRVVARDAMGYVIGYYNRDFTPVRSDHDSYSLAFDPMAYQLSDSARPLYNGNIAQIWNNFGYYNPSHDMNTYTNVLLYTYSYDQLQRLKNQLVINAEYVVGREPTLTSTTDYAMSLFYSADGKITDLQRNGFHSNQGGLELDDLSYSYYSGGNRLEMITETVSDAAYTSDIDEAAGVTANYVYDATGNLTEDKSEHISSITWNIANKPVQITRTQDPQVVVQNYYDASGNRICKQVDDERQVYVRDAQGNILCVYSWKSDPEIGSQAVVKQEEVILYGSSRLGSWQPSRQCNTTYCLAETSHFSHYRNQRAYELSNHLGNVMVTVSDQKIGRASDESAPYIYYYDPTIISSQDYYPGGMLMPGRSYSSNAYKFGMNGQEKDDEIAGNGNIYSALYWEYDSRSLRRWNTDPVLKTWESPYACFSGNPIWFSDPLGNNAGDYRNQQGVKIATDGIEDGKNYVVSDDKEAADNTNADGSVKTVAPGSIPSAMQLPSGTQISAIKSAQDRSNTPNKAVGDKKGGFHEEGLVSGTDAKGNEVTKPSPPGNYVNPYKTGQAASIQTFTASDVAGLTNVITAHIHCSGESGPPAQLEVGTSVGKEYNIGYFIQQPSATDLSNAVDRYNNGTVTGNNFVIGAGSTANGGQKVYIYNGKGQQATFPLDAFYKLGK